VIGAIKEAVHSPHHGIKMIPPCPGLNVKQNANRRQGSGVVGTFMKNASKNLSFYTMPIFPTVVSFYFGPKADSLRPFKKMNDSKSELVPSCSPSSGHTSSRLHLPCCICALGQKKARIIRLWYLTAFPSLNRFLIPGRRFNSSPGTPCTKG